MGFYNYESYTLHTISWEIVEISFHKRQSWKHSYHGLSDAYVFAIYTHTHESRKMFASTELAES